MRLCLYLISSNLNRLRRRQAHWPDEALPLRGTASPQEQTASSAHAAGPLSRQLWGMIGSEAVLVLERSETSIENSYRNEAPKTVQN
jgi:hypothetical protein